MMREEKKTSRVGRDLTQGSIVQSLLVFALPMVMTSLIQQFYSTVDLIVVGQYIGNIGTVAVSTGSQPADIMTGIAMSVATGGQIYVAQLAGAGNRKKLGEATGTILTVLFLLSLVVMSIVLGLRYSLLAFLNCPTEALHAAAGYMTIAAIGLPFIFLYNGICAILRGMGESTWPMIFSFISSLINIVGDVVLVAVFRMGVPGTAIATVASQIGSFCATAIYLYRHREEFNFTLQLSYFRPRARVIRILCILGLPQTIRLIIVQIAMIWMKSSINSYGLVASSAYSIGSKIDNLLLVFANSVENAGAAMIGQNYGARKFDRVNHIMWRMLAMTLFWAALIGTLFLLIPDTLFSFFTTDPDVIAIGRIFLRIAAIGLPLAMSASTFKTISTGVGAAALSMLIGILDAVGRVLGCIICVYGLGLGLEGYFWGNQCCWIMTGIISFIYFRSGIWKKKRLLSEQ